MTINDLRKWQEKLLGPVFNKERFNYLEGDTQNVVQWVGTYSEAIPLSVTSGSLQRLSLHTFSNTTCTRFIGLLLPEAGYYFMIIT